MIPQTISAIGAFTAFACTVDTPDYFKIDPARCADCDDPPLRVTEEPAPGQDGALILPPFDDVWIPTIGGDLVVTSNGASSEAGYFTALEVLYQSLKSALDALKAAPDALVHADGTLQVWKHGPAEKTWSSYWVASVTFELAVDVFA